MAFDDLVIPPLREFDDFFPGNSFNFFSMTHNVWLVIYEVNSFLQVEMLVLDHQTLMICPDWITEL